MTPGHAGMLHVDHAHSQGSVYQAEVNPPVILFIVPAFADHYGQVGFGEAG